MQYLTETLDFLCRKRNLCQSERVRTMGITELTWLVKLVLLLAQLVKRKFGQGVARTRAIKFPRKATGDAMQLPA